MSQRSNTIARWIWRFLKFAMVVAVIGGVVYRMKFSPLPVREQTIEHGEIVAEVMGTGTLEARVKVTVSPKISGRLQEILVDQGDRVVLGDLLVKLDDEELSQQVEIAQATLAASEAAVARLKTDRQRAEAVETQAKQNHKRVEQLIARKAVSESDLDKAVESLAIAESGVARSEAAITEGETAIIAAEKTLAFHHARLADTQITAPFGGLIVRRQLDPGDIAVPGSPMLSLVSLDELWISAWIDETEMAHLAVEQNARVVFRSEPDRSYPGKVTRLGRETDRETREFIVDVQVLELPKNWAVGQRAEVYIETARKQDRTLLPATFLQRREKAPGVFVNVEDRAVWRGVELGIRSSAFFEVISGLQPGDSIVVADDAKKTLKDGQRIAAP